MNDIQTTQKQLPATAEELVDYVVINEEKLNAVKAAIRAAKKAGDIQLDKLEAQKRELEIATISAQCRLGEITAEMEKGTNQYALPSVGIATKKQALKELGIQQQRASEYEQMARHPEIVQRVIDDGENISKASVLKAIKEERKEAEKAKREEAKAQQIEAGAHQIDLFSTKDKYRVIYADPPWQYSDKQNVSTMGGAEKHYPTMPLEEICKLPIPSEENAVLFLWTTSPMLEDSFKVINAWGFNYKSSFVWDKISHNMGHYNSVRHEFLLICTKGSCTPDHVKLFDSVQSIERTEHSAKPTEFRSIIDTLYTHGKKIELFARTPADGWDVWGNMV